MHKHKINLENKKLDDLVRNIKKDEAGGCGQYGLSRDWITVFSESAPGIFKYIYERNALG